MQHQECLISMKGYIYKLISPSEKCYIGQTVNPKRRFSEYRTFHHCQNQRKLFNALKKYGWENFKEEILEVIEEESLLSLKDSLNSREVYYIKLYDSISCGYNICEGGNQYRLGVKETEEQKQRKRNSWTKEKRKRQSERFKGKNNPRYGVSTKVYSKKINQYDKTGKYIKTWEGAIYVEKTLGFKASNIGKVCLGKCLTAYGFIWKFYNNSKDNIVPQKSKRGRQSKKGINAKVILQYSKDGVFIKEFSSIVSVEIELGIEHTNISACAKGNRKTAGGYIWKYKE